MKPENKCDNTVGTTSHTQYVQLLAHSPLKVVSLEVVPPPVVPAVVPVLGSVLEPVGSSVDGVSVDGV